MKGLVNKCLPQQIHMHRRKHRHSEIFIKSQKLVFTLLLRVAGDAEHVLKPKRQDGNKEKWGPVQNK